LAIITTVCKYRHPEDHVTVLTSSPKQGD